MRELDSLSSRPSAQVRIRDYGTGSFTSIFAGLLDEMAASHPEIDVRFVRVNEDDAHLIATGEIDVGFVRTVTVDGQEFLERQPDLTYLRLSSDVSPLVFGARSGHPLLDVEHPTLRDVALWRLAMPTDTDQGAFPLAVKRLFADMGIDLQTESVYCDSSSEHFFEYFSGMNPDSVAFFTERSYADYMSSIRLGWRHQQMVRLTEADYQVIAYAIYPSSSDNPALPIIVDAIHRIDAAMA